MLHNVALSLPRLRFIAISHTETTLTNISLTPSQITAFAFRESAGLSSKYQKAGGLIQSNGLPNQESIIYSGRTLAAQANGHHNTAISQERRAL
jgi:hypothetical protein